jgi:hypothetical protein
VNLSSYGVGKMIKLNKKIILLALNEYIKQHENGDIHDG